MYSWTAESNSGPEGNSYLPLSLSWVHRSTEAIHLRPSLVDSLDQLSSELNLTAAFLYGSALFHAPSMCHDLDIVAVTRAPQPLTHLTLHRSDLPPISVTLVSVTILRQDLRGLSYAGYLLNKFINPLLPLIGAPSVRMWQAEASMAVSTVSGNSLSSILYWKDEQFPGWRSTHRSPSTPTSLQQSIHQKALDDLTRSAAIRGHWDVYRGLRRAVWPISCHPRYSKTLRLHWSR
jgi:hypothetical protein